MFYGNLQTAKEIIQTGIAARNPFRYFFLFFCVLLLISSGCVKKETPKKVSLIKKTVEKQEVIDYPSQDTIWFGFDLRLGPKEDVRIYIPMLKYLESATGRRFRIKFSEKYEDTVDDLGKGVTHFAAVGPLSYIIGEARYGIKYLVSGVNTEGDTTYHSVIFTAPNSRIKNLKDLKGKCFAFGSKMSTQGHLIPRKMLEDDGVTLKDLGRYIYTVSHFDTAKLVLNGECDAGGIQDVLAKKLASEGKIKILKVSGPYPNSLIAYNGTVENKTVEAVRAALLAFDPSGKQKDTLVDWDKTEMPMGFVKVNELELDKIRSLAKEYGLLTQ